MNDDVRPETVDHVHDPGAPGRLLERVEVGISEHGDGHPVGFGRQTADLDVHPPHPWDPSRLGEPPECEAEHDGRQNDRDQPRTQRILDARDE